MSDPERWQHVERLFHAAVARGASERTAFLREACAGDDQLRREVESLLEFAGSAEGFLQGSAMELSPSLIQSATAAPLLGGRLGPYEFVALLGAGGMGDVYRARDTTLERDVAIKILPEVFTADAGRRARFEREARLLAALNHPHIGAIYGVEHREGLHGLVLELVEGETLAERLRAGPLPLRDALAVARQIADALDAAHEKGIVHRDLKPSNITITPDGVVKVLDFGLAKAGLEDSAEEGRPRDDESREGLILGTAAYMSPEQARGRRVDKRADIWAFGCVLWEMLAGRAAFGGETVSDTIAAVLDRDPAWAALPADTPPRVLRLLRRCLDKDPKRRLRDIADAELELDDSPAEDGPPPKGSWREAAAWSVATIAVLGALLSAGAIFSTSPAPPRGARFHVLPPAEGPIRDVALAPDGRRLAFVSPDADRQSRLWVRPVDALDARALEGTEDANAPFWSPDGRFIGFFARGKLRKVAADGGAPQILADATGAWGGAWSPAGTIVFAPDSDSGLFRVSANGGRAEPATTRRSGEIGHRYPQFLADGRRFLYLAQTGRGTGSGMFAGSLDSGDASLVLETVVRALYAPPGYLLFMRGNALMAQAFEPETLRLSGDVVAVAEDIDYDTGGGMSDFTVAGDVLVYRQRDANPGELMWLDREGRRSPSPVPRGGYIHPWLSPDGRRAAVETVDRDTGAHAVWILDLVRGSGAPFVAGPAQSHFPVWSPDGRTILFSSDRGGPWTLLARPASGSGPDHELLTPSTSSLAIDWSRDGRFVLYQADDPSTRTDIWALPVVPRGKPFAVLNSPRNERQAQLSPDGRWLAYVSDAGGRDDVWVQGFPEAGDKWPVSTSGGVQPQWRRDGRELFYISADRQLMAVEVDAAGATFDAGVPRALFSIGFSDRLSARNNYMPAPDGSRFLINTSYTNPATGVAVVLDWARVMSDR